MIKQFFNLIAKYSEMKFDKKLNSIMIIGTQRSGSNLLRVMLNQSNDISAPHPPHILNIFQPLFNRYKSTYVDSYPQKLAKDILELVNKNPVGWDYHFNDADQLLSEVKNITPISIFEWIYCKYAQIKETKYWCCKSLQNIHFFDEFEKSGIHPKYLHIVRDGRDVALSMQKSLAGNKHIYHIAQQWKMEQGLALQIEKQVEKNRFISIFYEDLIEKPEVILHKICAFLNIDFEETMLQYFNSTESIKTATAGKRWMNLKKPIIEKNKEHYLDKSWYNELKIFESIAGKVLTQFNYALRIPKGSKISFSREEIGSFNFENIRLKIEIIEKLSIEEKNKLYKRNALIKKIDSKLKPY